MWPLLVRFAPRLVVVVTHRLRGRPLPMSAHVADGNMLRRRGLVSLDSLVAASPYGGSPEVRRAILDFKYRYHPLLHRRLADLIAAAAREEGIAVGDAVLCPVPCGWLRRHVRGYNQSELLAFSVGRLLDVPVRRLLRRVRTRGSQTTRSRAERFAASARGFAVRPRVAVPRRVILIDDVATTGATLDACAARLKAAGAARVEAWVVAHDPPQLDRRER